MPRAAANGRQRRLQRPRRQGTIEPLFYSCVGRGAVTTRGIALAVGLLTPAAWLLWAERLDAGWPAVLATAGLWWLAALQATWRVWLPAGVTAGALWLALPPRAPRRRGVQAPAEALPPAGAGVAAGADPEGRPDLARRSPAELIVRSRTPEGAATLAAEGEAARGAGPWALEPMAEPAAAREIDSAPPPEGEGEGEGAEEGAPEPEPDTQESTQEPTPAPPRAVVPRSVPAPPRTVWEAFAPLHQETAEENDADDAA